MKTGTPILPAGDFSQRVSSDAVDAEQAIQLAVGEYLRGLEFVQTGRAGTRLVAPRRFRFVDVFDEWPEPNRALAYPCAALHSPVATYARHALTATTIDASLGRYDGEGRRRTVLWKLGELTMDLALDVFASTPGDREAVLARLPSAFAPGEDAARVLLRGSPLYWCLPVRARLLEHRRIDEADAIVAHEYRARALVRADVDVVDLRCATLLDVRTHLTADEMIAVAGD